MFWDNLSVGTDLLYRNVGDKCQSTLHKTLGDLRSHLLSSGSLKSYTLSSIKESGQIKMCMIFYSVAHTRFPPFQGLYLNDLRAWLPESYINTVLFVIRHELVGLNSRVSATR